MREEVGPRGRQAHRQIRSRILEEHGFEAAGCLEKIEAHSEGSRLKLDDVNVGVYSC